MSKTTSQQAAIRRHGKALADQIDNAVGHLDAAQAPFADLLDGLDEIEAEFGDAEPFATLLQDATNKLREARSLLSPLPGTRLTVTSGGTS